MDRRISLVYLLSKSDPLSYYSSRSQDVGKVSVMDEEIARVVQAVYIAADPTQDRTLHSQALEYLSNVQQNPETWRLALSLFIEVAPDGTRKHSPQVRLWALRVLEDFLDER